MTDLTKPSKTKIFKAKMFRRMAAGEFNPFNPTKIIIGEDFLEIRKRNIFLIGVDVQSYHWEDLNAIAIDSHLYGVSIIINNQTKNPHNGFTKVMASQIHNLIKPRIQSSSNKGVADQITSAITEAMKGNSGGVSVADELTKLKGLLDNGVLTQEEFDNKKKQILESN